MKQSTIDILNDKKYLDINSRYISRLTDIFNGTAKHGKPYILNGIYGRSPIDPYNEPELWVEDCLDYIAAEAEKLSNPNVFRPLCVEFGPYGVHFIDKVFGCHVYFDESSKQWYNSYLPTPIGDLVLPDLEHNDTWLLVKRAAKAFLNAKVSVPFFGLPTIASVLNAAVNLYGQDILIEMCMDKDKAEHDLRIINYVLCHMHRWYIENIPEKQLQPVIAGHRTQPPGFGQICGCTTQLLSANMYNDIVAPLDHELLSVYPNGGMIHLCGSHTQHIPVWREMKSLRSLQLNDRAAADLEIYHRELRDDQIIYLNPCDEMPADRAMDITKGHRIIFVTDDVGFINCHCTN